RESGTAARMKIRRVAPDGSLSTIATLPAPPGETLYGSNDGIVPAPDGGAWVLANVNFAPNQPIWHVAPNGTLSKGTAGDRNVSQRATPNGGNGLPASQVVLEEPNRLVLGPDGSLYIGSNLERLQHINGAGVLETVYEDGVSPALPGYNTDHEFAFAPDSSL